MSCIIEWIAGEIGRPLLQNQVERVIHDHHVWFTEIP